VPLKQAKRPSPWPLTPTLFVPMHPTTPTPPPFPKPKPWASGPRCPSSLRAADAISSLSLTPSLLFSPRNIQRLPLGPRFQRKSFEINLRAHMIIEAADKKSCRCISKVLSLHVGRCMSVVVCRSFHCMSVVACRSFHPVVRIQLLAPTCCNLLI